MDNYVRSHRSGLLAPLPSGQGDSIIQILYRIVIRYHLSIAIFLILGGNCAGEISEKLLGTPVYQQFPIQRQLGERKVRKIIQNPTNYIIALAGNSILIFDGERWTKIQIRGLYNPHSLINRKGGGFWISDYHDAGYITLNQNSDWIFESIKDAFPEELKNRPNWTVHLETEDGTVYMSAGDWVIAYHETKGAHTWKNIGHINGIYQTKGKLFCITDYPIITELQPEGRFRRIQEKGDGLYGLTGVYGSTLNADGDLIISTKEFGIIRFDGQSYQAILPGSFFKDGEFPREIVQSGSGEYIIGLENGGYLRFDEHAGVFSKTKQIEEFLLTEVKSLHVDHLDGLWFSQTNRIFRLNLGIEAEVFSANHGLNGEVLTIREYNKQIYFGTERSLYRFNQNASIENNLFERLDGPIRIQTLCEFMGKLFVGASNGLFSWDGENMVLHDERDYQQLAIDPNSPNRLFSAGSNGLYSVEFHPDKSHTLQTISENIFGYGLIFDKKGQLWIGLGQARVGRYNPNNPSAGVKIYDEGSGVDNAWIAPFLLEGKLYINGRDHIQEYDDESDSWIRNQSMEYFPGGSQGMGFMLSVRDAAGKDWVNGSVSSFNLVPLGKRRILPALYELNPNFDERVKAFFRTFDNDLWIARGVNCIRIRKTDTEPEVSSEAKPPVIIRVLDANTGDLIAQDYLNSLNNLELSSSQNSLEFQFGSLDFETIGQNFYWVYLDGYHKSEQVFRPEATRVFTNLRHGRYSLRLRTQTRDLYFSPEEIFTFRIPTPLYLQWWAKLLYFIGITGILYFIYTLRVRTIRLRNIQLEQVVEARTEEIKQGERNYRLLFDSSDDYYLVSRYADGKLGTIVNANAVVFTATRCSLSQLKKRTLEDMLSPVTRNVFAKIENDLGSKDRSIQEAELLTETGESIPVEVFSQVFDRGDGIFALSAARDITKRLESDKLKEDVQRITEHDLKIPLLAAISLPEIMLEDGNLDESQKEYLAIIRDSGQKMLDMINRSLDLYKMEKGTYHYNPSFFNAYRLFHYLQTYLSPMVSGSDVELDFSIMSEGEEGNDQLQICADELLLSSVLSNLIKNAIEASLQSTPSKVEVILESHQDQSIIFIKNEQCVPIEIRDRFFEKYVTSGKDSGTGLGTYSAKLMVETMNGEITLDSDESSGTTVTIKLPTVP